MKALPTRRVSYSVSLIAFTMIVGNSTRIFAAGPDIIEKPMSCCFKQRSPNTIVDTVVLHFSSDASANPTNPYDIGRIIGLFKAANVSAHYLIDRDGTIYRLVKEDDKAFHAGDGKLPREPSRTDLNDSSIGIELLAIGTKAEMASVLSNEANNQIKDIHRGYTEKQYKSLKTLLKDISQRRKEIKPDRKHVVGHDALSPSRKTDPGSLFDWTKIGLVN
jgi:N-acetyl-anhydromuramyl-L-alanine amidase AmpD